MHRAILVLLLPLLVSPRPAGAQTEPLAIRRHPLNIGSVGMRSNSGPDPRVVFAESIDVGDVAWVRLRFSSAALEPGSILRITSAYDGETQVLDRAGLAAWRNTTAYFNGPMVQVELVAAPGTTANSVTIAEAVTDDAAAAAINPRRVCTVADTRVPSSNPGTSRLLSFFSGACTGWITDRIANDDPNNRCMLTAGHCFGPSSDLPNGITDPAIVAQFDVPASNANCTVNHPPINKQFPIVGVVDYEDGNGTPPDWAAFVCGRNTAGRTVFQEQNYQFALGAPALGRASKFGYGTVGPAVAPPPPDQDLINCDCTPNDPKAPLSETQQKSGGNISNVVAGNAVTHDIPTCGGDSGAPVLEGDVAAFADNAARVAVAVHDGGICGAGVPGPPTNSGTDVTRARLQAALDDCVVVANHYQCYEVKPGQFSGPLVDLVDQFGAFDDVLVQRPERLCAPADKNDENPSDVFTQTHFIGYRVRYPFTARLDQRVVNQFGETFVDVTAPDRLMVPTSKDLDVTPPTIPPDQPPLRHYQCYKVRHTPGTPRFRPVPNVKIADQFGTFTATVRSVKRLCAPVDKNDEEPGAENAAEHLLCYRLSRTSFTQTTAYTSNQFGILAPVLIHRTELCVSSLKNPPVTTTTTPGTTSTSTSVVTTTTSTSTTLQTECCDVPPGALGNPVPVCLDAAVPDVQVKCSLLGGALTTGVCDPNLEQCVAGGPVPPSDFCCECPVPDPPFPHPQVCFEGVIGHEFKCQPPCVLQPAVTCGPLTERCGGSPSGAFVAGD